MQEYDEIKINGSIPQWMKIIMIFVDRIGFPALAFCLMFYMSYSSLGKVSTAMVQMTTALSEYRVESIAFRNQVIKDHDKLQDCINKVMIK